MARNAGGSGVRIEGTGFRFVLVVCAHGEGQRGSGFQYTVVSGLQANLQFCGERNVQAGQIQRRNGVGRIRVEREHVIFGIQPADGTLQAEVVADQPRGLGLEPLRGGFASIQGNGLLARRTVGVGERKHLVTLQIFELRVERCDVQTQAAVQEVRLVADFVVGVGFRVVVDAGRHGRAGFAVTAGEETGSDAEVKERAVGRLVVEHDAPCGLRPLFAVVGDESVLRVRQWVVALIDLRTGQSRAAD